MHPKACNFIKKETLAQVFSCEIWKTLARRQLLVILFYEIKKKRVSEVLGCCTVNIILHMIYKISHANITYSLVAFLVNYSSFGDHV